MGLYHDLKMKNVIIRAPLLSYSGYGTHARQVFRWLLTKKNINVYTAIVPWGITPWMINPEFENGLVEKIMEKSQPVDGIKCDVSIQLQLPNEWDPNFADVNIGMSAFVETDKCNPAWLDCCNKMDKVIVPTTHIKKVIENSGECLTEVEVVPESFYDEISNDKLPPFSEKFDTDFNFLVFGQFTGNAPENDRKNLFNTMKWLCEIFRDDSSVGIIFKTNSGKNTKIDKTLTERLVRQLIKEVRTGPYPKIHFLHGAMSSKEIASLYRCPSVKALVSLTRGEGFGLPLLEAAASGLPVIATKWSGHLDFLNLGKFIPVDYILEDIPKSRIDNQIFIAGAKWANVSEKSVKQRLKKFRKSPNVPKQWALDLRKVLLKKFSQKHINAYYDLAFRDFIK